ncbi:hypothetical protein N7481_003353 [Penicillium waksmanii]|uniref:uncharacterized protein n=1 Tax=Penicillium waksmanii TaxID=69791 RepID=UPI002546FAC2|nr:uncharacterized protein N7481_003353 [Penicillium waksmanii]KAJ5988143.1 hypothetical protein N7481_003353 [Penicillium waksmanii]
MLEHNEDMYHRDHDQSTALYFAARFDSVEIAEILLDAGAELNVLNNKSNSALMVAIDYGSSNVADFLLRHGAQIGHYDNFGQTAFDVAGSLEIVQKLLDWGVDPSFSLPNGRTALHIAAISDNIGITECLIQHGSATTCMDIKDYTPLDEAVIKAKSKSTVQWLIRHGGFTGPNEAAPSEKLVAKWSAITQHELESREITDMTGKEVCYRLWFHGPESEKEDTDAETDTGSDGVSSIECAFANLPFFFW